MAYMNKELVRVDFETWIKKYPESIKRKLREALHPDRDRHTVPMVYEAFTKVELQVTQIWHELKETELNDCKERQICGPQDLKKALANPFIYFLEGIASKYMPEYCGRANWLEICESLEKNEAKFGKLLWGASDGSGFDMTQFREMNELMNELLMAAANHKNVEWVEPMSIRRFEECIKGSLDLKVSVDHGKLRYQAEGRASGDGWTTFGNTILMVSYWKFTMHLAGITDYVLKVKGDDVLFGIPPKMKPQLLEAIKLVFTDRKDFHSHGLGQICKKVDFGELTDLDFLSNEFFLTSEGKYRMTRIPWRVMQTTSWSTKVPKNNMRSEKKFKARQELVYSKGKCLEAWADGLPIFGALAQKMIELGRPGELSEYDQYSDGMRVWHKGRDDYDAYLYYLENKYGITPAQVEATEKKIRAIKRLDGTIHLPELQGLYHKL